MTKPQLALIAPGTENETVAETEALTVAPATNAAPVLEPAVPQPVLRLVERGSPPAKHLPPKRRRNSEVRSREHLLESEVEALIKAAGDNRNGFRDGAMILVCYRHALRVSELVGLRWEQVDFERGELHVRRLKGSLPSTHPLTGRELRMLRRLKREQEPASAFVFVSEHRAPFTAGGFRKMLARLGKRTRLGALAHPHALRHGCGYKLACDEVNFRSLQHYLGHAQAANTTRYTQLAPTRFKGFWKD